MTDQRPNRKPVRHPLARPNLPSDAQQDTPPDPQTNPRTNPRIAPATTGTVPVSRQATAADQSPHTSAPTSQYVNTDVSAKHSPQGWVIRNPQGLIAGDVIERNGWRVAVPEGADQENRGRQDTQKITEISVSVPDYAPCGKNYSLSLGFPNCPSGEKEATREVVDGWAGSFDVVRQKVVRPR